MAPIREPEYASDRQTLFFKWFAAISLSTNTSTQMYENVARWIWQESKSSIVRLNTLIVIDIGDRWCRFSAACITHVIGKTRARLIRLVRSEGTFREEHRCYVCPICEHLARAGALFWKKRSRLCEIGFRLTFSQDDAASRTDIVSRMWIWIQKNWCKCPHLASLSPPPSPALINVLGSHSKQGQIEQPRWIDFMCGKWTIVLETTIFISVGWIRILGGLHCQWCESTMKSLWIRFRWPWINEIKTINDFSLSSHEFQSRDFPFIYFLFSFVFFYSSLSCAFLRKKRL